MDLELNFSLRLACCSLQKTSLGPVVRATLRVHTNLGKSNPPITAEIDGRSSGTSQCVYVACKGRTELDEDGAGTDYTLS